MTNSFLSFILMTFALQATLDAPIEYENRQVDYGPLAVRALTGIVRDEQGAVIPEAQVGLFSEPEHRLISYANTDTKGVFRLPTVATGDYRLVCQYDHFCPANAKVRLVRWPRGGVMHGRKLVITMTPAAIDKCSVIDYR